MRSSLPPASAPPRQHVRPNEDGSRWQIRAFADSGCETRRIDAGRKPLERAYREEATRIRAALAARTGDVGLAEDAVQDAFIEAIEHWPRDGVPANPGGWLATTARRKALDRLRRDKVGADKMALLAATEVWACPDTGPGAAVDAATDGGDGGG